MAEVAVAGLTKMYGRVPALDDVTLRFADGSFFGLLGPSGSGKTTLLRAIAGFVFVDRGTVAIGGEPVEHVPVERREIGMVFQNYALFPNMTVADNVGFGLTVRGLRGAALKRRVDEVLELVQLADLGGRRPQALSGGQRQRVALARAIVTRPRVLLLDEPLSALDKALRLDMQIELRRIQREVGITTIFVTHDQEEALTLSDRIGILRDGRLVQEGPPQQVYARPASRFAATFLGDANVFAGRPAAGGFHLADGTALPLAESAGAGPAGDGAAAAMIAVRPEEIRVIAAGATVPDGWPALSAVAGDRVFAGSVATHFFRWQDQTVRVLSKGAELAAVQPGDPVHLAWPPTATMPLPADG